MLGLALSGGGFRATLFHVGSLLRLNSAGLLTEIEEVTSVSGGSITAAHLALNWTRLQFDGQNVATNFDELITQPIREFCSRTIDVGVILGGIINPFHHASHLLTRNYRKHLFGEQTLQHFPRPGEGPRFTIYATSLQTGASVRFSRDILGEWHLGVIPEPDVEIAVAVAASSAFPPPLCPVTLELDPDRWVKTDIANLHHDKTLKSKMQLGDGGIYDNLGLERLMKNCERILVSDAGAPFGVDPKLTFERLSQLARTKRALDIISNQVRALRARYLVQDFASGRKRGAYWGIGTTIAEYPLGQLNLSPALVTDSDTTRAISGMRTRLNKFDGQEQSRLINWGFALADAALRSRYDTQIAALDNLPYDDFPI